MKTKKPKSPAKRPAWPLVHVMDPEARAELLELNRLHEVVKTAADKLQIAWSSWVDDRIAAAGLKQLLALESLSIEGERVHLVLVRKKA